MNQAEPNGKCWCGCGRAVKPGKFFYPNHDAKAYSALLKRYKTPKYGNDGLANLLLGLGFNPDNGVRAKRPRSSPRPLAASGGGFCS